MKIKIESPLVNITFEDEVVFKDGYTRHHVPSGNDLLILIQRMNQTAKEMIHETIRAQKHGCIDLKKWEIPDNADKIEVIVEK